MLECTENIEMLLTHSLVPAGPIPTTHDPDSLYPYESYCETSKRPSLKTYRMVTVENDKLRVKICPDLGGRVCSIFLKDSQTESLYFPNAIRPVRILPRQAFTGGGIELSFPISHTPVEIFPVLCSIARNPERIYVCCGEKEIRYGMNWTVEYSLGEQDAFLTQRTVFFNPGAEAHPWMSWSNAGVPARPDTQFHFPGGPVLAHGRQMRIIDWDREGPRCQSDIRRMTGYFWKDPDCSAFGIFTPSLRAGLYHVADRAAVPGIKLWSDGIGRDEAWVSQYTLDGKQCLEIQAGPLVDQSVKDALQPGQLRHHVEFWIPSPQPLDVRKIPLPERHLRPVIDVPLFGWARTEEVALWCDLVEAHRSQDVTRIPEAPGLDSNQWAISGYPELGEALAWACASTHGRAHNCWLFQYGTWLAARRHGDAALEALSQSADDRARALSGRLYLSRRDPRTAAECFRAIQSEAMALHPQVVVERDRALAALGLSTLAERERWLNAVSALEDEWIAERRASLNIDRGDFYSAMHILKETHFQRVHQRYERTHLWRAVERGLGLPSVDHPAWLGEDDLAEFGAYREHSNQ
jgi:hypothetical protein